MTLERQTEYCPGCGMQTERLPLADPLVGTANIYDCRGVEHACRIGYDAVACEVCGAVSPDQPAAMKLIGEVQAGHLRDTFSDQCGVLVTCVQAECERFARSAATWLIAGMFLALTVCGWVSPDAAPLGLLVPLLGGGAVLTFGFGRQRLADRAIQQWGKRMNQRKARAGRKGNS